LEQAPLLEGAGLGRPRRRFAGGFSAGLPALRPRRKLLPGTRSVV